MFGKDKSALIGMVVLVCIAIVVGIIAIAMSVGNNNQPTSADGETVESPETAPVEHYEPELFVIEADRNSDLKIFCDGPDRIYFNVDIIRIARNSANCPDQRCVGEVFG